MHVYLQKQFLLERKYNCQFNYLFCLIITAKVSESNLFLLVTNFISLNKFLRFTWFFFSGNMINNIRTSLLFCWKCLDTFNLYLLIQKFNFYSKSISFRKIKIHFSNYLLRLLIFVAKIYKPSAFTEFIQALQQSTNKILIVSYYFVSMHYMIKSTRIPIIFG